MKRLATSLPFPNFSIASFLLFFTLSACGGLYPVDTFVWDVSDESDFRSFFPEKDVLPETEAISLGSVPDFRSDAFIEGVEQEQTFGLAFSGGGTRAATMALGQLRALHELGWIKKVHYISAVSGGSWTVVPYSFLPGKEPESSRNCTNEGAAGNWAFTDKQFLGTYIPPEELSWKAINSEPDESSMAGAISESWLGIKTIWHLMTNLNDEAYATAVGDTFLEPFGLSEQVGILDTQTRSFALRPESIVGSGREPEDFYFMRCGRPYPIINATVITKGFRHNQEHLKHFEITPDYAGVRSRYNIPDEPLDNPGRFGGQYIQSFAYDFHQRDQTDGSGPFGKWQVMTGGRTGAFTLSDVIGVSGSAPQDFLTKVGLGNLGFPEYHLWPHETGPGMEVPRKDFYHGDGGHLENLGLMPLLSRRVQNILAFVNTRTPFECRTEGCTPDTGEKISKENLARYVIGFFRQLKDTDGNPRKYFHNFVFEDGEAKLESLVSAFENLKDAGRPLVHCDTYSVKENSHYGVRNVAGYNPNICWVYLDRSDDWLNAIGDEEIKNYATRKWRNLPHFKTFFPALFKPSVVDLSNAEVNLGSNLAAWSVCESTKKIDDGLSPSLDLNAGSDTKNACKH